MPQPDQGSVHVDRPLTNMSVQFIQDDTNFVASRVFPDIMVDRQSDVYYTFSRADFLRDSMRRRGPGTESAGSGYTVSTDSYKADVWGLHKDIPDQVRANSDAPLNPDRNAAQYLTQQYLIRREVQFVTEAFTTSVWGLDLTGVAAAPGANQFLQWNDAAADPIIDIETAKRAILASTGFMPNKLTLGYDVYRYLRNHPDIVDRVKYTSAETVTPTLLARLFDVGEVLVAKAVKVTSEEGETDVYAFTHGKHALLTYTPPNPGIEVPAAGYTFSWRGVGSGFGGPVALDRFRMEPIKSDRVEIEAAFDLKIVSTILGVFLASAVV